MEMPQQFNIPFNRVSDNIMEYFLQYIQWSMLKSKGQLFLMVVEMGASSDGREDMNQTCVLSNRVCVCVHRILGKNLSLGIKNGSKFPKCYPKEEVSLENQHCFMCTSVQFSHSVVSNSLQPHELQHTRLPCPLQTPRVYSNSCPLSWWCHPAISSSVIPFSSCSQSLSASGSFLMSQLFS